MDGRESGESSEELSMQMFRSLVNLEGFLSTWKIQHIIYSKKVVLGGKP